MVKDFLVKLLCEIVQARFLGLYFKMGENSSSKTLVDLSKCRLAVRILRRFWFGNVCLAHDRGNECLMRALRLTSEDEAGRISLTTRA